MAPLADALARLGRRWAMWWPGIDAEALAADVRERLAAASAAWDLERVDPFGTGEVALVCAATRGAERVVLKVTPRGHPDDAYISAEARALAFWQPTGAVPHLLATRDGDLTVLMERLEPGTTLDDASRPWEQRLAVLGRLAARLHEAGPPADPFPHISEVTAGWRRVLGDDPELDALLAPSPADVLIHSDLHGGNALRDGDGWKAIDPHAILADRNADIWALLDPLVPEFSDPRQAHDWLARYADAANLDPERAAAFTRLRARAEALTIDAHPDPPAEDVAWARRLHRMADALGA